MAYTTIGNTVAEWNDDEPLIFTMTEEISSKDAKGTTMALNLQVSGLVLAKEEKR